MNRNVWFTTIRSHIEWISNLTGHGWRGLDNRKCRVKDSSIIVMFYSIREDHENKAS